MKIRIARHTADLNPLIDFYTSCLKLEILASFKDHDTYNGVFLGLPDEDWHLEFTVSNETYKPVAAANDDMLVFYFENQQKYEAVINRLKDAQHEQVQAKNPYWNDNGAMFLDPDGNRVIIAKY